MAERYPEAPLPLPLPLPMDPIETLIHEKFDQLIVSLNRRREQLIAEHRDRQEDKHAANTGRIQTLQQLRDSKTDLQTRMKDNLLHSVRERLLEEIDTQMRQLEVVARDMEVVLECNTLQLEETISALGQLVEIEIVPFPNYSAMIQPRISFGELRKDQTNFDFPNGLAFDERTQLIYVANRSISLFNSSIIVFSVEGEYIDTLCEGQVKCPVGIAISEDSVYVSDSHLHSIFHFKLLGFHLMTKVGKQGTGKGEFSFPRQLTVAANGSVFVADSGNNRVAVMTDKLRYQRSISHASMTEPYDVRILDNKVFVLSRRDNPCLHVFSQSGEKLRSLITCGKEGDKQIIEGYSFCFDRQRNILISDYSDNSIKVFSQEGALLHTLGDTQAEGKRIQPRGIAVTNNNKVICASIFTHFGLHIFY